MFNMKPDDFVSEVIKRTGPHSYLIGIYTMLKGKGYKWIEGGFLKVDPSVSGPKFYAPRDEVDFFAFIGMPWTEPKMRRYGVFWPRDEPDNKTPITPDELRAWRDCQRWVGTNCGGEPHQYSVRVGQRSDEEFCRVAHTIYELGYVGFYLGRSWRYLDLDGIRYFTVDYRICETALINRKPYFTKEHTIRPWAKNPNELVLRSAFSDNKH